MIKKLFILSLCLCSFPLYIQAQASSLLEKIISSRESIVHVHAITQVVAPVGQQKAMLDPKTGRILVARIVPALTQEKKGAGVIITASGLIVTNIHTIQDSQKIAVILHDGTTLGASVLFLHPEHDLALLKIEPPHPLRPIEFANSDEVKLRDEVINIGSSDALDETISGGMVNGLGVAKPSHKDENPMVEVIKVNMNLYKGDSGGPLLNKEGKLIGIIVAKLHHKNRSTLAIPSNKIKKLYFDYMK
jgi:S1-C subfamily serine protease